jgi:hypothetical protein
VFHALLTAVALADDPSGARPGAGAPELVWTPLLDVRTSAEGAQRGDTSRAHLSAAGRVGVELERKVLRARLSVQAAQAWEAEGGSAGGGTASLGEAWLSFTPPISSAIGMSASAGIQPVEVDEGLLIGADDRRRTAHFPLAGRLSLRAVPWRFEGVLGLSAGPDPGLTGGPIEDRTPFAAGRLSLGRENPVWRWEVAATALQLMSEPDGGGLTGGLTATAGLNRVRLDLAAYLQEGESAPGVFVRARAGLSMGEESRAVLRAGFLSRGTAENPAFQRPLATQDAHGGWLGLLDEEAVVRDAFLDLEATLAPPLRLHAQAHHFWLDGTPLGPELDLDLAWYWSPLAALRLRGSALTPWSADEPVRLAGALSLEATVP